MRFTFKRPSEYAKSIATAEPVDQPPTIQEWIKQTEAELSQWYELSQAAKQAGATADAATQPILSIYDDEQIRELRTQAQRALEASSAATAALREFEEAHGCETEITRRLEALEVKRIEAEKAEIRRKVGAILKQQLALLTELEVRQAELLEVHQNARKRFGDWAYELHPGLPDGLFPLQGALLPNTLVGGFRFLMARFDRSLLDRGDEVLKDLERNEAWGYNLKYAGYKTRY
jgi:hypothetical protein